MAVSWPGGAAAQWAVRELAMGATVAAGAAAWHARRTRRPTRRAVSPGPFTRDYDLRGLIRPVTAAPPRPFATNFALILSGLRAAIGAACGRPALAGRVVDQPRRSLAGPLAVCRIPHPAGMVQNRRMTDFIPFNREQSYLLPPDLKRWLPEDDVAHFVIAAVERVELSAFR